MKSPSLITMLVTGTKSRSVSYGSFL